MIKQYTHNGKVLYEVYVSIRIHKKQVGRRRKNISSQALAKREETKLLLELIKQRDCPYQYTWNTWSAKCLESIKVQFCNSTLIGYQTNFNKWVNPVLGNRLLEDITSGDIHDLIFNRVQNLGSESRKNILKHIKRVFTMAVDEGILSRNPAKGIKVKSSESKKLVLNKTEIDVLLLEAKIRNHPFFNHWVLALLTGMRTGELYALQWSDIDLDGGFISVTKSWNRKNGFGPTKSCLNRVVPVAKVLKEFLLSLKSEYTSPTDPVLEKLQEWTDGRQAEILKDFCAEIGISTIRFHDLRATFITQLLLQGVPVAKVMAIVGHAQLKTTMVYVRLVGNDVKGVTDELRITLPALHSAENVIKMFPTPVG